MIGKTISHYKIIDKIGEGGMGIVYKALDIKLDRFVALKFLPPHLGRDNAQKQRFIHEAKAASALDHPNICTVYEIDETDADEHTSFGQIFIALAYYEGNTLQDKITRDAPLSIDESIGIIMQIARGLQKAHEADIVHRDIKPANIIITAEGDVKIVDFGLAKLKGQTKITKEDSTLGTIAYMSPEQAEGTEIDARTDIWSLGIIFYEMLTASSPFAADYDQAVIYNILNSNPESVCDLNKSVPRELNSVVQKCLVKDRESRYRTVKEFLSDLIQVINKYNYSIRMGSNEFNLTAVRSGKRKVSSALSVIAALVLISVMTILFFLLGEVKYTGYEAAFFERRFSEAMEKSKDDRTPDNIKAHRYYLLSAAYVNQDTIPPEVENEYRDLLMQNPGSAQAHYYLGLMHFAAGKQRSQRDSVWLLFDQARVLGMDDIYLDLDLAAFYMRYGFTQEALEIVNTMIERDPQNPDVLSQIGSYFYFPAKDTVRAREYFEKTLSLYENHLETLIGLCRIALDNNNLHDAKINLEKIEHTNNEDYTVVSMKSEIYERQGKFKAAEEYLNSVINSFGANDIRFYQYLSKIYQKLDMFDKCEELIQKASIKFPSASYFSELKKSLVTRKDWLKIQSDYDRDKNMISWQDDFEAALEKAAREKKPILLEFYSPLEFWSKSLLEKTYPDNEVQKILKSFIPLRINGEIRKDLSYKYHVAYFPRLLILNAQGEKLHSVRYWMEPPGPEELIEDLNEGLAQSQRYLDGLAPENLQTAEVSNIEDAVLLAKAKQMPVMTMVLSSESKWSEKLVNETLTDPMLQTDLQKVILVKINQAVNKNLVRRWNITYFPSIIFFDDAGNIVYQIQGYHTPKALSELISGINNVLERGQEFQERIRWFHDLDEARSAASLQKKEILIYCDADWCPFCETLEKKVFTDPLFIETVNERYIPIELNDSKDMELINAFGVDGFPTLIILDARLTELTRISGAYDASTMMSVLDLDERKPIYSILGPEKYRLFYKYENLSEKFFDRNFYHSFIRINQKQIDIYPDYWQSYHAIGYAHLQLKNPNEALHYFQQAIDYGAEINESIADDMMTAYVESNDLTGFETWINHTTRLRKTHPEELKVLKKIAAKLDDLMQKKILN